MALALRKKGWKPAILATSLPGRMGEGLPRGFRLTTEGGPDAPPALAPAMYAREHGLPPHLPWSGRDSGGMRGVAGGVSTAAVESYFGHILACGGLFTVREGSLLCRPSTP